MKLIRTAVVATALAATCAWAQASPFSCIAGSAGDCALATSTLSWTWDGQDFTISNSGSGYVSEVYFDVTPGMSVAFTGGTGTVNFYSGASPGSLPGGGSVGFTSDRSFDSDAPGNPHYGIDANESATFRILGATLDSFDLGALGAGLHVRSLLTASASLVTIGTENKVPEPQALAMAALGIGFVGFAARRKKA